MRARMALVAAEQEVELREIVLRDKPAHMLQASPKGTVPVLVRSDAPVLEESLDVMLWALGKHDPDLWLTPPNGTKEDMLALVHTMDGDFKTHLDRYKYASRYDETLKRGDIDLSHRAEAVKILQNFERVLEAQSFLNGDTFGPTDMATFPFIRQFAAVEPDWWAYDSGLPKTRYWLKACLASDLFKAVMEKHPLWAPPE